MMQDRWSEGCNVGYAQCCSRQHNDCPGHFYLIIVVASLIGIWRHVLMLCDLLNTLIPTLTVAGQLCRQISAVETQTMLISNCLIWVGYPRAENRYEVLLFHKADPLWRNFCFAAVFVLCGVFRSCVHSSMFIPTTDEIFPRKLKNKLSLDTSSPAQYSHCIWGFPYFHVFSQ